MIYPNTFAMIDRIITELGDAHGTRFEFECYDVGHLYNLDYFVRAGRVKPPFLVQCILGVRGGIGADLENLQHMVRIADNRNERVWADDHALQAWFDTARLDWVRWLGPQMPADPVERQAFLRQKREAGEMIAAKLEALLPA